MPSLGDGNLSLQDLITQKAEDVADHVKDVVYKWYTKDRTPKADALNAAFELGGKFLTIKAEIIAVGAILISVAASIATGFLQILSDVKKTARPALNTLVAEGMSELLGVQISDEDIQRGGENQTNDQRSRTIGGKLHDLLTSEFAPDGTVSPDSGEAAARTFTGYNIGFSTESAMISILGEAGTMGLVGNFREVGEEIAKNLGLGRMHRMAIKPLIDNTIAKPYDRQLRKRYRQDKASESQYVKGLSRGAFTPEFIREELAQKGYSDDIIEEIIVQLTPRLSNAEIVNAYHGGRLSFDSAMAAIRAQGFTAEQANELIVQHKSQLNERQLVNTLNAGRRSDDIVREQLRAKGLTDDVIDELVLQLTPRLDAAQLFTLARYGDIDPSTALQSLRDQGHTAEVATRQLRLQELSREDAVLDSYLAKAQHLAEQKFMTQEEFASLIQPLPITDEERERRKSLVALSWDFPHKRISTAQLFQMEEAGILDLAYFDTWCKGEGFSDEDAINLELLLFVKEQALAKKAAAAEAAAKRKAAGTSTPGTP